MSEPFRLTTFALYLERRPIMAIISLQSRCSLRNETSVMSFNFEKYTFLDASAPPTFNRFDRRAGSLDCGFSPPNTFAPRRLFVCFAARHANYRGAVLPEKRGSNLLNSNIGAIVLIMAPNIINPVLIRVF